MDRVNFWLSSLLEKEYRRDRSKSANDKEAENQIKRGPETAAAWRSSISNRIQLSGQALSAAEDLHVLRLKFVSEREALLERHRAELLSLSQNTSAEASRLFDSIQAASGVQPGPGWDVEYLPTGPVLVRSEDTPYTVAVHHAMVERATGATTH